MAQVIQERPERRQPFIVRWTFDGRACQRPFEFRQQARDFQARLLVASRDETKWNAGTGLPSSWGGSSEYNVAAWCRRWLGEEWEGLAPKSRLAIALTLVFVIERSARTKAPALTVEQRRELRDWLAPGSPDLSAPLAAWVARWSPALDTLDGPALYELDRRMRLRVDGGAPLGPKTARRQANTARQCFDAAVRAHVLDENPWPKPALGVARRKKARAEARKATSLRLVLSVESAHAVLDALPNHRPESWKYRTLTAIGFFVGTRPGEAVTLEVEDFVLPEEGWGSVHIERSWNGAGAGWGAAGEDVGDPKTFERTVPVSPFLVAEVRAYIARTGITSGPLFLNANGKPPQMTNWRRALELACAKAEVRRIRPYDCRHFCATQLTDSGLPLGRVARLLGHDAETLVRYYLHDSEVNESETVARMGRAFGE